MTSRFEDWCFSDWVNDQRVLVDEGAEIPWHLGLAYFDFRTAQAVCYPIPLNWVVRFVRWVWFTLRSPTVFSYEGEYKQGYDDGKASMEHLMDHMEDIHYRRGYRMGWDHREAYIEEAIRKWSLKEGLNDNPRS